jgi:glucose-6-phosphate 1-dehydrogenase
MKMQISLITIRNEMKIPENQILIIFGASGDLTKRKLIPALYDLFRQNLLPERFAVLGASRTVLTDSEFRKQAEQFLPSEKEVEQFKNLLFMKRFHPLNLPVLKTLSCGWKSWGRILTLSQLPVLPFHTTVSL